MGAGETGVLRGRGLGGGAPRGQGAAGPRGDGRALVTGKSAAFYLGNFWEKIIAICTMTTPGVTP